MPGDPCEADPWPTRGELMLVATTIPTPAGAPSDMGSAHSSGVTRGTVPYHLHRDNAPAVQNSGRWRVRRDLLARWGRHGWSAENGGLDRDRTVP
jgi:hypothetical protein